MAEFQLLWFQVPVLVLLAYIKIYGDVQYTRYKNRDATLLFLLPIFTSWS